MDELSVFVRDSPSSVKSRDDVREALSQAGWPRDEIDDTLSRFAEIDFPMPVPRRRTSGSAREAFLYLVTFMMLYTAAISMGNLLCAFVDTWMPDAVQDPSGGDYDHEGMRWLIASLIVSFPVWFLLTRSHLMSYAKDPERRGSAVRRWLTYLTLFVAASTVLITMIVLLAGALGGEHVVRTILKSAVVILISGGIFGFYLWELRRGEARDAH